MNAQFQTGKGKLYRFTVGIYERADGTHGPPAMTDFSRRGACGGLFSYKLEYSHVDDETAVYRVIEETKT
jgi:hypothetical protein